MSTPAVTPDKPFEFTLGDGTPIKAASVEEAFKIVAKMKEDTAAALKAEKERATTAENERLRLESELNRRPQPVQNNGSGPQFDRQHYYEMLNSDPLAAQDYVDAFRFGIPQEQVRPAFIKMSQEVSEMRQNMIANQFTQQHMDDYPIGDPTAARILSTRMEELCLRQGYPFDVRTMNLAWGELVSEGAIKPNAPSTSADEETPTPPPALYGGGSQVLTQTDAQRIESMTDKELEAFLRSNGKLG